MTTKQTIDGVPRELLENCASYMEGSASGTVRIWHDRLRALLDASESQYDGMTTEQAQMVSQGVDELIFGQPAAQHQGASRWR